MPVRKVINKGIEAILSFQNIDGGIPATAAEKPSGCWTSADTLEAILVSGIYSKYGVGRIKKIVNFLIDSQIGSHEIQANTPKVRSNFKYGSWSLFQGQDPSTMATGHSVTSLYLASTFLEDDPLFHERIVRAVKAGLEWIERNQNEDGSWGTQPQSGNAGKEGSIIAIMYAMLPYKYINFTMQNSSTVQRSVKYLRTKQNRDGSWSSGRNKNGDPSNTARAVTCLIRAGYNDSSCINRGVSFILNNQIPDRGLWEIEAERFDIEKAPAQLIFNNNTNCDIMVAFMEADYYGEESVKLFKWLLSSQNDDGLWYLSSPTKTVAEICTWSTAEWVFAIDFASKKLIGNKANLFKKEKANLKWLLFLGFAIILVYNTYYTYRENISQWWNSLNEKTRENTFWVIIIGIIVAALGAAIWDWIKSLFKVVKTHFKKWFNLKFRKQENN